jgi:phosphoglycerate dehydrogenase-like enzyme
MAQPVLLVLADAGDPYLPLLDAIRDRSEIVIGDSAAALAAAAPRADAFLAWTVRRKDIEIILATATRLRWMHVRWAGLDSLLFPALIESHVPLTNSRGVYSQSLGEFVIAGALFFAKDIRRLLRQQSEHKWEPFTMPELRGATMGIVGYGDIGRACAARAHAFGMRVLASRRRPSLTGSDPIVDRSYGPAELIEMIRECDYVVAAAPLTPQTRGLIGEREIAAMKPSAVLMNVGRGPVVDEQALIGALRERRIRGAALDVFTTEPLPRDSPLFDFDNILISPHCADNTPTFNEDAMKFFIANFDRFLKNEPLLNIVDKHAGY